jgi:hypothetical protein
MSKRAFKNKQVFEDTFINYINVCKLEKNLPNIAGFCVFANINRDTFYAQKEIYSDTFKRINEILEDATINSKDINDTFKIFYMKNKFGYKDKQESVNVEMNYEDYIKKVADEDEY